MEFELGDDGAIGQPWHGSGFTCTFEQQLFLGERILEISIGAAGAIDTAMTSASENAILLNITRLINTKRLICQPDYGVERILALQFVNDIENVFAFNLSKARRLMVKKIVLIIVFACLISPMAFGQMRYSRSKSSPSPSASPTPSATPQQRMASGSRPNQRPPLIPSQKAGSVPMKSPTPYAGMTQAPPRIQGQQPQIAQQRSISVAPQTKPTPFGGMTQATPRIQGQASPAPQSRSLPMAGQQKTAAFGMRGQPQPSPGLAVIPPRSAATPPPAPVKPTPAPVPPPDVKAYLDKQVASSKDQKFHLNANGKDIALTPFHVWRQRETGAGTTATCVDMRSDEGRVYDIDFETTGAQVTGIRVHRINGEAVRSR